MPTALQVKSSEFKKQGYNLVSDEFTAGGAKVYDYDTARDQVYTVTLSERVEPVNPDNPTPQPNTPVNPGQPDSPRWPGTVSMIWITRKVLAVPSITFTKMEARLRMMWLKH